MLIINNREIIQIFLLMQKIYVVFLHVIVYEIFSHKWDDAIGREIMPPCGVKQNCISNYSGKFVHFNRI